MTAYTFALEPTKKGERFLLKDAHQTLGYTVAPVLVSTWRVESASHQR